MVVSSVNFPIIRKSDDMRVRYRLDGPSMDFETERERLDAGRHAARAPARRHHDHERTAVFSVVEHLRHRSQTVWMRRGVHSVVEYKRQTPL